jgi:hypothetical protein
MIVFSHCRASSWPTGESGPSRTTTKIRVHDGVDYARKYRVGVDEQLTIGISRSGSLAYPVSQPI